MAKFGLTMDNNGVIYAGTIDKNGRMNNKGDVTEQALEAVRDHIIAMSRKDGKDGYAWTLSDGNKLVLQLKIEEQKK